MPYTSKFIREFSLGGLPSSAVWRGVTAANGLVALFGPDWIQRAYPSQKSPVFVRRAIAQWDQWRHVRQLPGADALAPRLRLPDDDTWTEVYVIARLMRAVTSVELEPIVGNGKADCRFRTDHAWTYVEVTKRSKLAPAARSAQRLINQLAQAAAGAVPGRHGVVALLREPRAGEAATLRSWLRNCGVARAVLDDLAIYDSLPWESATNEPPGVTFALDEPRVWAVHAASIGLKGSASMPVVDLGAEAVLRKAARQLPRGAAGVVCIEMTALVGGWEQWVGLVKRRLQAHSRVAGVVLFQRYLSLAGYLDSRRAVAKSVRR